MKHAQVLLLPIIVTVGLAGDALSQEQDAFEPLMVSKESNGELNKVSREAVRRLDMLARQNGYTAVWVTLASTYLPEYVGQLSPTELADQDRRATRQLKRILNPLVQSGNARHAKDGPLIRGPGCLVMVDQKGLRALVRDRRIAQIVGRKVRLDAGS